MIRREFMVVREIGRWRYRTAQPVHYDTIAGPVIVPEGYDFHIGAGGIALPPFCRGLLRAACLHDYLYDVWGTQEDVAGLAHADTAMIAELRRHRTPWPVRWLVWIVIRCWGAIR